MIKMPACYNPECKHNNITVYALQKGFRSLEPVADPLEPCLKLAEHQRILWRHGDNPGVEWYFCEVCSGAIKAFNKVLL
jgi:hypothetical protein